MPLAARLVDSYLEITALPIIHIVYTFLLLRAK